MTNKQNDIDIYIAGFPENTQQLLKQLRAAIKKAAPEAEELLSYGMPAYKYKGILVYFAAYKNHIGLYPTASGIEAFKQKISGYKSSKGTVQFTIDKPLPLKLITEIVRFKVKTNLEKTKKKPKET